MFDTGSVFDVLASDDSDRRLAQRKALALSQARLDNTLGRFLQGAVTTDEFQARMAAVQEDFARHVAEASAEVGYDQPERLMPVLTSHYERGRRWQPIHSFGTPQVHYDGPAHPYADAGGEDDHLGAPNFPNGSPNVPGNCPNCGSPNVDQGTCMDCGFNGGDPYAGRPQVDGYMASRQSQDIKKVNPAEMQDSNDGKGVNEPHQDDEDKDAPKIKSSAEIRNPLDNNCTRCGARVDRASAYGNSGQPDQILCANCAQASRESDAAQEPRAASRRTADGNTDLGGPEPKMDKRLWEPSNLGDPEVADGRWPTERKDMVDPIGPPSNEHPLKEIGEKFTETQSLPSETENSGFQSGGPGPAPHTDTFGNDGQATPVTRETQPE